MNKPKAVSELRSHLGFRMHHHGLRRFRCRSIPEQILIHSVHRQSTPSQVFRTDGIFLADSAFTTFGIIGYAILIGNDPRKKPGVSYFAIYLAAMGIYPLISNIVALTAGNTEGAYKRSVVMAVSVPFLGFFASSGILKLLKHLGDHFVW